MLEERINISNVTFGKLKSIHQHRRTKNLRVPTSIHYTGLYPTNSEANNIIRTNLPKFDALSNIAEIRHPCNWSITTVLELF